MNYFKFTRGTPQGNPMSVYLFILMLEVVIAVIKWNQNIDKLRIFGYDFLYTAYADDTTFFVKNQTFAI